MGWFMAGAAAAVAALAIRERLRGESHDDLPAAVGLDDAFETVGDAADEVTADAEAAAVHTDQAADELREEIEGGRERLRRKARAGTADSEETGELRIEREDDPPEAG
jgi:hypothetical protein